MEAAARRVVRSGAEWQAIIEAQARSQRTAAGFCREQEIEYKQFLYHRNKIRKRGGKHLAMTVPASAFPRARQRGFIPIMVEARVGVRIYFSRGFKVESDELPPAAWVAEVALRCGDAEASPC